MTRGNAHIPAIARYQKGAKIRYLAESGIGRIQYSNDYSGLAQIPNSGPIFPESVGIWKTPVFFNDLDNAPDSEYSPTPYGVGVNRLRLRLAVSPLAGKAGFKRKPEATPTSSRFLSEGDAMSTGPPGHQSSQQADGGEHRQTPRRRPGHIVNLKEINMTTLTLPQTGKLASHQSEPPIPALSNHGKDSTLTILALDLGQKTGWALYACDKRITSGTALFRPGRFESAGMSYLRFRQWLAELQHTSGGLDLIVFEEVRAHKGTTAAQVYGAFLGQLTAWAEYEGIPYEGVPVATIKRHVTGKGNAGKPAVIAAVCCLGFSPADDNEADALALLDWALTNHGRLGQ